MVTSLPLPLQKVSMLYVSIYILYSIGFHSTDTFLLLYLLDYWDYRTISLIFTIQIITQLIFDYPTGVLGDWLGQKLVIVMAYFLKIGSLLPLMINPQLFSLVIYGILSGLGNSQLSGALESWFDNKYHQLSLKLDPNREFYTKFQARLTMVYVLVAAGTCFLSGLMATLFSRKLLFVIEIIMYIGILILVIRKLQKGEKVEKKSLSVRHYLSNFQTGLEFVFRRRDMVLFFIGFAIYEAFFNGVWTKLILMPYFQMYTFTDTNLGLFRWIDLTLDILLLSLVQNIPAKSKKPKRGFLLSQLGMTGGLLLIVTFISFFPPGEVFQISKFVGILGMGMVAGFSYRFIYLFYSKIMLDLVPDKIRNSVYSLLPTVILILTIPATIGGGEVITNYGLIGGIVMVIFGLLIGIILQCIGFRKQITSLHIG